MEEKEQRYFVGKVQEFSKQRGWFFGAFADEPLLQSNFVEVGWQHISNVAPSPSQKHFHKHSVEINILLSGWMDITINGTQHQLGPGDFYIVWPYTVVEELTTGENTELIVIRAPSLPDDKFSVS